jgi:hypothetical protein
VRQGVFENFAVIFLAVYVEWANLNLIIKETIECDEEPSPNLPVILT